MYYSKIFSQNLRQYLKLAFIDHRGFGLTNKATTLSDFELKLLIDDIEAFRQYLGFDKVIIVGHSGHGYMALEYAKTYPQYVSHVVLLGMGVDQSLKSHHAAQSYFKSHASEGRKLQFENDMAGLHDAIANSPNDRFITFCLRFGARSWYDYTVDATSLWKGVAVNMQMFDYVWGEVFGDIDITKNLNALKAPVFLGLGKYDFLVAPYYTWDAIVPQFKDLTVRVFQKSGHTLPFEEPELFDQAVLDWIKSHPAG